MCNIARIMQTNPVIRKSSKRNNDSKYSKYEETIQVDKVYFFFNIMSLWFPLFCTAFDGYCDVTVKNP